MPLTNAQKQHNHRQKKAARMAKFQSALDQIVARLDGNTKPLANELRAIALEALSEGNTKP